MNERQIAFITCVNDEEEYAECCHYLGRQQIPEGYSADIISIREASSMASGYNAGMKSSNAKYKVYLHQDTFIKNTGFIMDLLRVFACDPQIGLVGMVGNTDMGMKLSTITRWDTGKVVESFRQWDDGLSFKKDMFKEVQAVDGLLLATQYDIPWREDIFDNWHFYDISQSIEFRRAGYKVVVPWQEEAWCYHDGVYSYKGRAGFYDHYERFVFEYAKMLEEPTEDKIVDPTECELGRKYALQMETLQMEVEKLFEVCGEERAVLRGLFLHGDFHEWRCLREYEAVLYIDQKEELQQSRSRFWEGKMSVSQLVLKLRSLKRALKRIEYGVDDRECERVQEVYSKYAIIEVCERYIIDKDKVYKKLMLEESHD